ncbi:MAG TPA: wax ester/triacylglycerol synthase family O-acyltransferase [Pilimelia sp.]|nr:wax ester/triacylglycerol synthase family O-acyltransferase [Pilimelia sp.]
MRTVIIVERLSPLDAAFLDAEDEDPHASLAIGSVAVLEGPPPSHEEFAAAIGRRLPLVPRYRQRLRTLPLDLGQPVWVDDAGFDLDYHVRRTALPEPGDDDALCRLVARLMSQRLDRERPLWETWAVEGLRGGRWAIVSKVHHCLADGVSGTNLYRALCDAPEEEAAAGEDVWVPRPAPSTVRLVAGALGDLARSPVEQLRLLMWAVQTPARTVQAVRSVTRGLGTLATALTPASGSSLSGPIGRPRSYRLVRASMTDVTHVGKTFGASINDVALAAISAGFRALLRARGERPEPHAIRSLVPVSVRARDDGGVSGNRISMMLALLPADIDDPVERLRVVHARLATLKASKEAEAGAAMTALAEHEPYPPISWAIRLAARLPQRSIVTVTTNVPGPRQPLFVLGRPILEIFPYVPIALRLRTGVAVLTYCDQIAFGVTSDYTSTPEADLLAAAIEEGVAELVAAARSAASASSRQKPADSRRARRKAAAGRSEPALPTG